MCIIESYSCIGCICLQIKLIAPFPMVSTSVDEKHYSQLWDHGSNIHSMQESTIKWVFIIARYNIGWAQLFPLNCLGVASSHSSSFFFLSVSYTSNHSLFLQRIGCYYLCFPSNLDHRATTLLTQLRCFIDKDKDLKT